MDECIFSRPALQPMHKLRNLDPKKYYELCTTHLSFLVNDIPVEALNVNLFLSRQEKKAKGQKVGKNIFRSGVMDGAPLTQEGICRVYQLIEFIAREENICQKNLFRRPGNKKRQDQLKFLLNSGAIIDIDSQALNVYDCCEVMKRFLGELGEPLLLSNLYEIHCEIGSMVRKATSCSQKTRTRTKQLNAARILLLLMPVESYQLFYSVLSLLSKVAELEKVNLMNAESLSIIFTPQLLIPWKRADISVTDTLPAATESMTFLIKNFPVLFEPPIRLLNDVRKYLQHLDEGNLDWDMKPSVVFCQPVQTKTSSKDYTHNQLLELLGNVEAMPPCPEKKHFFKRFKEQDNHLTPNQLNVTESSRHTRSSSVSDSIKKYFGRSMRKKVVRRTSSCDRFTHNYTDKLSESTPIRLHLFRKKTK